MKSVAMFIIDPQNDFCLPQGTLYVKGAYDDMERLGNFIKNNAKSIDKFFVSLDTHSHHQIFNPHFWVDSEGNFPEPFTVITLEDVLNGKWKTAEESDFEGAKKYLKSLSENKRYNLVLWPDHCIVGTLGANVIRSVESQLDLVDHKVKYIVKGTNIMSEHYSVIKSEDAELNDVNHELLLESEKFDDILVTGEALDYCVANTVRDMIAIQPKFASKLVLLINTMSSVKAPGFEDAGDKFIADMKALGVRVMTTKEYSF